jgi:hypothetical protein
MTKEEEKKKVYNIDKMISAIEQLKAKHGPVYEKWKERMEMSLAKKRRRQRNKKRGGKK